ncbi:hypothetical protein B0H21DRAFT_156860 [Amylocystis lapponica]|nr:hypothetical protein B0H21DRAFT_156860 [Amylocystis lapponica]
MAQHYMEVDYPLPPIRCLIEDILEDIFFKLRPRQAFTEGFRPDRQTPDMTLLAISHVCRHWRSVALWSPRLWTTILFDSNTSFAMVQEFLIRSAQMSLQICLIADDMPVARVFQAFELLLPHVSRIKTFTLSVLPAHETGPISYVLSRLLSSALRLENLKVIALPFVDLPIPFPIQTPMLRTVICAGICHPWTLGVFRGLTALGVCIDSTPPSLQEIMDILRHCLTLERLTLNFAARIIPGHIADCPRPTSRIELSYLHTLDITSIKTVDVSYFLSHLIFPDTVGLTLNIKTARNGSTLILPYACVTFRRLMDRLDSLILLQDHQGGMRTKAMLGDTAATRGQLHFRWFWQPRGPDRHRTINFQQYQFSALRRLIINKTTMSKEEWVTFLGSAPNLTWLRLMPSGSDTLDEDLRCHDALLTALNPTRADGRTLLCPRLVFLSINASPLAVQRLVQDLAGCCRLRSLHSVPITSLTIWYKEGEELHVGPLAMLEHAVFVVHRRQLPHDWATSQVHWESW